MSTINVFYDVNKTGKSFSEVTGMKEALGYEKVVNNSTYTIFNSFEKHKYLMNTDFLVSNRAYVFFTCPDMNLSGGESDTNFSTTTDKNNQFFVSVKNNTNLKSLFTYFNGSGFIFPLTNLAENFENSDTVLKTEKFYSTPYGEHMVLPQFYFDSATGGEFTINYSEVASMYITTLHKLWIDYIQLVRLGYLVPKSKYISNDAKTTGGLDYVGSVYYFLVGEDGETIKYWSKYTGVFPTNIPYSAFNFEQGNDPVRKKLSINYSYSFKSDMEEDIFTDFNHVMKTDIAGSQKSDRMAYYNNWAKSVQVVKKSKANSDGTSSCEFKLVWA